MVQTYKKSIQEIKGDKNWSALERELLENCRAGIPFAGKPGLPDPKDTSRHVRPELITYLLLGGCDDEDEGAQPTAQGVRLTGAYLTGRLEFERERTKFDLMLANCCIPNGTNFKDAAVGGLLFQNCRVENGLDLHRIKVQNDVFLRAKTSVQGGVDLGGAQIDGQLTCREGCFENANGPALNCCRTMIGSSVFLSDGFTAKGEVNLRGAQIGGQLACRKGRFENADEPALNCDGAMIGSDVFLREGFSASGEVNLVGARIGGQLDCTEGHFENAKGRALNCEAAVIGADVFLREGFSVKGRVIFSRAQITGDFRLTNTQLNGGVDLETAQIGAGLFFHKVTGDITLFDLTEAKLESLRDDAVSWNVVKEARLGGLTYDRIDSDMSFDERIDTWAPRDRVGAPTDYDPQPLTQLANVLERMGRRKEAARARYRREKLVGLWQREVWRNEPKPSWRAAVQLLRADAAALVDRGFRWMFGYGHYPALALVWTSAIIIFAYFLYGAAYTAHQMAPNSDVVLTSPVWQTILSASDTCVKEVAADCVAPLEKWKATRTQVDYESFSPFLYAVDLFVPLDALGQESTWTPSKDRGLLGWWAYWMRMPIQVMGWVIAAVGAAVVTGVIGRKDR